MTDSQLKQYIDTAIRNKTGVATISRGEVSDALFFVIDAKASREEIDNVDNTSDAQKVQSGPIKEALDDKYDASNPNDFVNAQQAADAAPVQTSDIQNFENTSQLNDRDTANRNRSNHTGSQEINTIIGLQAILNDKLEASDIADFETSTQLNSRDTVNRNVDNHTDGSTNRLFTDILKQKLDGIENEAEVNDTAEEIRDKLEGLEGEEKLNLENTRGGSALDQDQFEQDGTVEIEGVQVPKFRIKTDNQSTESSDAFLTSGTLYNELQNLNLPSILTDYIPALNIDNLEEKSIPEFTYRDSLRCNNYSLILYSGGASSNRILRTDDGITFREINTDSTNFWRLRKNTLGTIIAVSTTSSSNPIHRSTDGLNFSAKTLPEISSVQAETQMSGVASIGTTWITCGRTGDYRIFRSVDDGETWVESSTYPNDQTYIAATSINDIFLVLAQTGSDRLKRSTDLGENFDNISIPNRFWVDMISFKDKILLLRGGTGSTPLMMVSEDLGLTFTDLFTSTHPLFDSSFSMVKFSVVGEYLFIAGNDGVLLRTKDLQEYDLVSLPNSNDVATVISNSYNGSREILNIFSSSGDNRLISN